MRQLIIKSLSLVNFKGIRQTTATFGRKSTTVTGDNGAGKSSIADAFAWLLFGKNAAGTVDQQFSIKTVDSDGQVIPDLEHVVEGRFSLLNTDTGEIDEFTLRRAYVEEWRVKAGETERKLTGHHTDYFYNDIPVKKSEYEAKIAAIIPSGVFKLLTDPAAFLNQPWDAMRAKLTEIAGEVTPQDIAAGIQQYEALLQEMNGATIEEYRTKLGAARKRVDLELHKIPTRKDELARATPATPDYIALEARKGELENVIADIDRAAGNVAERRRLQFEQAAKIQEQINAQDRIRQQAKHEADMAASRERNEALRHRNDAEANINRLEAEKQQHANGASAAKYALQEASHLRRQIEKHEAEVADLRIQFQAIYNSNYSHGALICPRFGHQCTDPTACSKGEEAFNEAQVKRLTDMRQEGQQLNDRIARLRAEADDREATANAAYNTAIAKQLELEAQITQARANLPAIPEPVAPDYTSSPAWVEADRKISELRREYDNIMATPVAGDPSGGYVNTEAKHHAQQELDEVKRQLGLRQIIEANERRQRELDDQTRALASEKAEIERKLAAVEDFNVAIMTAAEHKVNSHFGMVQFKLFKTLVNGTREPVCIPTVNGVNFRDVNTAGQINAGLDVIQTLTAYHRFTAPIFVDNCESVADLRTVDDAQIIRLQFVKGQPLTITPEGD